MKHISNIFFLFHFIHIFIRPSASWAIDSKPIRVRGTIILVNIESKQLLLEKRHSAAFVLVFKAGAFRY